MSRVRRRSAAVAAAFAILSAAPSESATVAVTSARDSGRGSLREAIEIANREEGSVIDFRLGANAQIIVERALPEIVSAGIRVEGGGITLREGENCRRAGGQRGCDGLVVRAADVTVRRVRATGFTFDGIAVRGVGTERVRIDEVEAVDNLDDGIGVSEGARGVVVTRSLLMGNGFRTKGKGLLVFDDASATLRDSVVVANRDGVTVSRGATATLERTIVAGNFDKGVGVSAGRVDGEAVQVLGNGREEETEAVVPNGDGLRVGLEGRVELRGSRIAGSGDVGVVVLDRSRATLVGCEIEGNRGARTRVSPQATLVER